MPLNKYIVVFDLLSEKEPKTCSRVVFDAIPYHVIYLLLEVECFSGTYSGTNDLVLGLVTAHFLIFLCF